MPKHTPGPWELNGYSIEEKKVPSMVIATVYGPEDMPISDLETEANARLIAEAPAMLELIREALHGAEPKEWNPEARALLARIDEE